MSECNLLFDLINFSVEDFAFLFRVWSKKILVKPKFSYPITMFLNPFLSSASVTPHLFTVILLFHRIHKSLGGIIQWRNTVIKYINVYGVGYLEDVLLVYMNGLCSPVGARLLFVGTIKCEWPSILLC